MKRICLTLLIAFLAVMALLHWIKPKDSGDIFTYSRIDVADPSLSEPILEVYKDKGFLYARTEENVYRIHFDNLDGKWTNCADLVATE